jgi:hypothetical protein
MAHVEMIFDLEQHVALNPIRQNSPWFNESISA